MARFLDPKIIEKSKKIDSKRHPKIYQFLNRFFIDCCCVLEANLDPCCLPFSAQNGQRGLQDDPKSAPRSNTTWAVGVSLFWSPLGLDFGASGPRCSMRFKLNWIHFWMVWGPCFGHSFIDYLVDFRSIFSYRYKYRNFCDTFALAFTGVSGIDSSRERGGGIAALRHVG